MCILISYHPEHLTFTCSIYLGLQTKFTNFTGPRVTCQIIHITNVDSKQQEAQRVMRLPKLFPVRPPLLRLNRWRLLLVQESDDIVKLFCLVHSELILFCPTMP